MLLLARVAAHCCLLLLLRSQGNKANNYRVAQLGICIAVLCTYVHVVRGYTFMPPPPSQPTALPAEVRAPLCHIAKKRVIVPSAYCVALRRKALNHATKGAAAAATAVDEAPYLLNAAAQRRKARRGVAWLGRACGGSEEMRNVGVFIFVERGLFTFLDPYRIHC